MRRRRLMFPIWTTVEMDMYYTCGFSEVNSYGEECDLSWGLTEKSLSRKCEYVCQVSILKTNVPE